MSISQNLEGIICLKRSWWAQVLCERQNITCLWDARHKVREGHWWGNVRVGGGGAGAKLKARQIFQIITDSNMTKHGRKAYWEQRNWKQRLLCGARKNVLRPKKKKKLSPVTFELVPATGWGASSGADQNLDTWTLSHPNFIFLDEDCSALMNSYMTLKHKMQSHQGAKPFVFVYNWGSFQSSS